MEYKSYYDTLEKDILSIPYVTCLPSSLLDTTKLQLDITPCEVNSVSYFAFSRNGVSKTQTVKYKVLDSHKDHFLLGLSQLSEDLDIDNNPAYQIMCNGLKENQEEFQIWLLELFNLESGNEEFMLCLLELFTNFSYEDLSPIGYTISVACKASKYLSVQSKNLSLLGHWCNEPALKILTDFEEPQNTMMKIKYRHLKEIIQAHVLCQKNRGEKLE
jgi:hypothetical protein